MANNTNLSYPSAFYQQFIDKNGKPLVGGKLYTYSAGSTTSAVTYKTIGGGTESSNRNTNPIILDMAGMAKLVISTDIAYKFVLFDKNNVKIDEWDDVMAGGSEGSVSNVYVEGTNGEIDVREESTGLVRRFIISLSDSVKNAISDLSSSVNDIVNALYNKKDKQQPVTALGSATKVPVSILQNANGALDVEFDDIAFPDWTTAINNAVTNCEKTNNKKNSVTGYESSTTAYPSIKAVVDFVNSIMQNLGGKLITDNGNPFSDSADLPITTPYQGVNISDKDYAYVQGTGFAERWSASVSGSDVTWVQEYSINIPVFTPAQQAAIDSTATATKINNYDLHIANTAIHVTTTEKNTWNSKQNAISDLAEIRSGAAAGATALQPSGNGSNVTSTFTAASSRTNISSGEKLSTIFGKIAKWFTDLKAVAFSGSYNDLTDTPTIPIVNNGKLTIYRNGTALGSFSANQSSLLGIDIIVPTKTSDLNNDSDFLTKSGNGSNVTATFSEAGTRSNIGSGESLSTIFGKIKKFFSDLKSVAFTGNYSDLSGTPTIPAAANNGILTIKQNGTSKGTFSANQLSNTEINVTDTTYESKRAELGGTAESLVTTGEKYNWNAKQSALPIATTNPLRYDIQVVFAYNSTNASYSAKIGHATDHPQIGGNDVPTYVNDGGNVVEGWRTPNIKCAYANITSSNALALIHNVQGAKGTLILDPFRILCRINSDKIIIYVYAPVTTSESWKNAVLDGCIQWAVTTAGNTESYVEEINGRIPQDSSRTMGLGSATISSTLKQKMQANITMRVRRSDLNVNCTFMVNASFSIIKPAGTSDNAYVYAYSNMILF